MLHTAPQEGDLVAVDVERLRVDLCYVNSLLVKAHMAAPFPTLPEADSLADCGTARLLEAAQACQALVPLLTAKVREHAYRADVEQRVQLLAEELADRGAAAGRAQTRAGELERELGLLRGQNQYGGGGRPC